MSDRTHSRIAVIAIAATLPLAVAMAPAQAAGPADTGAKPPTTSKGPSSSQSPYLLPTARAVSTKAILTVGDKAGNGYRMAGIPDGLGAYDNRDGTFTLVMNHEIPQDKGITRAHGGKGAFVSKWVIDKATLKVINGSDLIRTVHLSPMSKGDLDINRLCSADLAPKSAYYDKHSGKGYDGYIFLNGEEDDDQGRGFAHLMDGNTYELPYLGRFAWENSLANPKTSQKTVVIGTDDSTPGQLYVYVGAKRKTGNPIEKAGLTGGKLYGISTPGALDEYDAKTKAEVAGGFRPKRFTLVDVGDASKMTSAQLQATSEAKGVTEWWRPEDGAWDVKNPNVFYFNTTAKVGGPSRLWKLTFKDATRPHLGGKVERLINGGKVQMLDNMAAAANGRQLILNEDVGGDARLGKVWSYNLLTRNLVEVAHHDPARFLDGGKSFLTQDEESSGTIDVSSILGKGSYLITTQAHQDSTDPELVQGGQLMLLRVPFANRAR